MQICTYVKYVYKCKCIYSFMHIRIYVYMYIFEHVKKVNLQICMNVNM